MSIKKTYQQRILEARINALLCLSDKDYRKFKKEEEKLWKELKK